MRCLLPLCVGLFSYACGVEDFPKQEARFIEQNKGLSLTECAWRYHCYHEQDKKFYVNLCESAQGSYSMEAKKLSYDEGKNTFLPINILQYFNLQKKSSEEKEEFLITENSHGFGADGDKDFFGKSLFSIQKKGGSGVLEFPVEGLVVRKQFPTPRFICEKRTSG